jgi:hypothetical protein
MSYLDYLNTVTIEEVAEELRDLMREMAVREEGILGTQVDKYNITMYNDGSFYITQSIRDEEKHYHYPKKNMTAQEYKDVKEVMYDAALIMDDFAELEVR